MQGRTLSITATEATTCVVCLDFVLRGMCFIYIHKWGLSFFSLSLASARRGISKNVIFFI